MEKVKLFWKVECPKCPQAKVLGNILRKEGLEVIDYDIETVDGLAEATYYGVLSTPTLIVEDPAENPIADFRGTIPSPDEIRKILVNSREVRKKHQLPV
ncbi:MAG TPA: thioredoxin family protein [Thermodesulfobacteriota bacterium]|nr:thioredoxin family protein [Thermodesulfobacteriota bacterium]